MIKHMNSYDKISTIILSVTTSAVLASMAVLLSSNISADSTSANATVTVGSACTMTATVDPAHTAEIPGGTTKTGIGSTTLKTICNDAGGYAIYAVGYSGDEYGNNKMLNGTNEINTGTGTSASNWNMSLSQVTTGTYATTIDGGFGSYSAIPATYTKVAHRDSMTDSTTGSSISLTYGAYISSTQAPGEYVGKVKFTMVHPANTISPGPHNTEAGCIRYYPNGGNVEGTMGCQQVTSSATSIELLASNFSRKGYGFAGWSDKHDYGPGSKYYGPQETISFAAGQYTGANPGLSLYAIWIESEGILQDGAKATSVCNRLTTAPVDGTANLASVSALTDARDSETYAIAKLADGNCWMIENLRLDNTAELTILNTNNPLHDGTTVTLKHNSADTDTHNTLSPSSDKAYNAETNPDGWCGTNSSACEDQTRLRTSNTTSRASNPTNDSGNMYSYGNYYNWYSATAGRGTYAFNTNNNSVAGDLCPAGWRLPNGGQTTVNDTAEPYLLGKAIMGQEPNQNTSGVGYSYYDTNPTNAIGKNGSAALRSYPNNFVSPGYIWAQYMNARGTDGFYWTSTTYSNKNAYGIHFDGDNFWPGSHFDNGKYSGLSIRCIMPSS